MSDDPVQTGGNAGEKPSGAAQQADGGTDSVTTPADGTAKGGFKHIRLVIALVVASLLGTFAVYTAIADTSIPVVGVAAAASDHDGQKIRLEGRVIASSGDAASPDGMRFTLRDFETANTVEVVYRGSVPDAYRVDREVIVDGTLQNGVFQAESGTLVAKCPSKYQEEASTDAASD